MTTATVHQQGKPNLSTVISLCIAVAAIVIAVIALTTARTTSTSTVPAPTPAVVRHAPVSTAPELDCRGHRVGSAC